MLSLEETLNHIFEITFGIVAGGVISDIFHAAAGIRDSGPFERFGREIAARYDWGNQNVTQQDAFFASPRSLLSVELKLGSPTWPEQVLKYLFLSFVEERLTGRRDHLALLYITPHLPDTVWAQAGINPDGSMPAGFIDQFDPDDLNQVLRQCIIEERDQLAELSRRLHFSHLTWLDLVTRCGSTISSLDQRYAGDETLARLLTGFIEAVRQCPGTKCNQASNAT